MLPIEPAILAGISGDRTDINGIKDWTVRYDFLAVAVLSPTIRDLGCYLLWVVTIVAGILLWLINHVSNSISPYLALYLQKSTVLATQSISPDLCGIRVEDYTGSHPVGINHSHTRDVAS
jgi:hypothetical protein